MEQENKKNAYVYAPFIPITNSVDINGETVWYRNKFKNLLLKIKFLFVKRPVVNMPKKIPGKNFLEYESLK